MPAKIDITVPHSLGAPIAFSRVVAWLNSQAPDPNVVRKSVTLDYGTHSVVLVLVVHNYPVTVVLTAEADSVHVHSSEATDWAERAGMWFESLQLKRQLAEVLK